MSKIDATDAELEQTFEAPEILVRSCDAGHVHLIWTGNGKVLVNAQFTREEATTLAQALMMAVYTADVTLKNVPGLVSGDAEPCTKH